MRATTHAADPITALSQAEITLFVLSVGLNPDALWLAGDTAQAVTHGVIFRFDDVRSVIYRYGGKIEKPLR